MQFISEPRLCALADVIPAGILKEATEILKQEKDAVGHESFQVGLALKAGGRTARHPVVMIPGVISTALLSALPRFVEEGANHRLGGCGSLGQVEFDNLCYGSAPTSDGGDWSHWISRLESWGTGEKTRPYFRKRL